MTTQNMPVLALRGLTAFPGQTLSFDAEREISILALENAMEGDRELLLVTQREIGVQDPQEEDLYEIGTVCRIFQIVKTSDTGVRVIAGGLHRAALRRLWQTKPFLQANVELLEDQSWRASDRTEALTRRTYALFGQYHELVGNLSDQLVASVLDIRDPGLLADTIAANINLRHQDRQRVLQELHPARRLLVMNEILVHEVDIAVLESDIDQKVRQRVGQVQRDMVLREQLHVLQHELGEDGDDELYEYEEKINRCRAGDEVREKLMKELHRLSKQPFGSAVCSKQLFKEALNHPFDEPKQWEIREVNDIMNHGITGWKYFSNPRIFEGYGRQKGWEREAPATGADNGREKTPDGFVEVTEQMELPF